MNYKEAGVDVEAGYKAVELMKEHVKQTHREGVVNDIGGFGGLFSLAKFFYGRTDSSFRYRWCRNKT